MVIERKTSPSVNRIFIIQNPGRIYNVNRLERRIKLVISGGLTYNVI